MGHHIPGVLRRGTGMSRAEQGRGEPRRDPATQIAHPCSLSFERSWTPKPVAYRPGPVLLFANQDVGEGVQHASSPGQTGRWGGKGVTICDGGYAEARQRSFEDEKGGRAKGVPTEVGDAISGIRQESH